MNAQKKGGAYKRKIDKTQIAVCNILGVDIAAINMDWLLEFTEKHIQDLSGDYLCVSNVHTTVMAYEDEEYCAVQNGGVMAIPERVTGIISMEPRRKRWTNCDNVWQKIIREYRLWECSVRHFAQ